MPQIFHRSWNVVSRLSIFGAVFILLFLGWVISKWARSAYATNAFVPVEQPVPFSHEHHAGGLGIDCRYCHTSVETSSFAGIPPTQICMNCHSQIWVGSELLAPVRESYRTGTPIVWNRVHNLAEFCNFNHAIHVQKGVGCVSCHGRVDRMPLTWQVNTLHMEWCLDCHRQPEKHLRPREQVFSMTWDPAVEGKDQATLGRELIEKYNVRSYTSCSTCHY